MNIYRKSFALAVLLATVAPGVLFAQVPPSRPGLAIAQPNYGVSGQIPQSTDLVQRDYNGQQPVPGTGQYPAYPAQPPQQDDLFYVDENSQGPDALAGGLSDYNTQRMNQAGDQLSGNYAGVSQNGMPAGMTQDAWNRPFDNMSQGQSAPGTIRYQWSSDLVMPVRLRAGMVTSIVLPQWEAAQDIVIGDPGAVEASILRPNQIAIKSIQTGLDTSLNITGGSGNVYTFYLRTEGRNTTKVTDLQVFVEAAPSKSNGEWFNGEKRNAYVAPPQTSADGSTSSSQAGGGGINLPNAASQGEEPVPTDRRIFNLKMFEVNEGDRSIAPEYAYTDGRFTYLTFPAGMTDRPAVFRIVDGIEGRVNTRVTGRQSEVIIVEAIGDFVLRSGTRAVCIKQVNAEDQVTPSRNK
ncbi:TrbG/VirB9 family P-type conjugative transfer protein [Loktanella sp. DJP18]|uniref:TrbG/VirB9 family P-type conjugative transfer protein n=1 Tax=Loktanella sp. DJP18 TaxID=3409788 RepID=UPI003BB5DC9E